MDEEKDDKLKQGFGSGSGSGSGSAKKMRIRNPEARSRSNKKEMRLGTARFLPLAFHHLNSWLNQLYKWWQARGRKRAWFNLIQGLDEAMETERCLNCHHFRPRSVSITSSSPSFVQKYLFKKVLTFIWKMIFPNQKNQSLRVWLLNVFKDQIMEVLSNHTLILWWLSTLAHYSFNLSVTRFFLPELDFFECLGNARLIFFAKFRLLP